MDGALSHIRALDLSRVLAGPWATQLLGDMGAEIVKVERPGKGDDTRGWGPPFLPGPDGRPTAETAYFLSANRGKKSVCIDMAAPRGQELIRALAAKSDVLIENFKVGGLARYGLDYASLCALNPRLVYCSITGFGQTGPYAARGGYDFMIQAMGGAMSLTGEPGGEPQKAGLPISDLFCGMYAAVAILAALAWRERSGEGQHIDLALLDSTVAMLSTMAANYFATGAPPARLGNAHPNVAPYRLYPTADGHIVATVGNDGQFAQLCAAVGRPECAADPRFASNADRLANRGALDAFIGAALRARPTAACLALLEERGVPCAPVNDIAAVFADPQVVHRGMKAELPHASGRAAAHAGSPLRFSRTPVRYTDSAPTLGAHTDSVLSGVLGLTDDEIAELRADGVI